MPEVERDAIAGVITVTIIVLVAACVVIVVGLIKDQARKTEATTAALREAHEEVRAREATRWVGSPPSPHESVQGYLRRRLNDIETRLQKMEAESTWKLRMQDGERP